jgi:CRP-like cAMP-binding protein
MDKLKHIIGKSALLSTIPQDEAFRCLSEGRFHVASHEKGRVVHFDGDICDRVEVILSGTVTVDRIDQSGNLLAIAELGSGDILGGNLVFSKNPRYPMTVTAQTTTVLLGIKKGLVLDLCFGNRDFSRKFPHGHFRSGIQSGR